MYEEFERLTMTEIKELIDQAQSREEGLFTKVSWLLKWGLHRSLLLRKNYYEMCNYRRYKRRR